MGSIGIGAGTARAAFDAERFTIGGEVRERYEFRNNADFNRKIDDTLGFVGSRIRLNLGYEAAPDIAFFFQIQDSRLMGSETSSISNEKNLDLHQGYLTVKNLAGPLMMTIGRQEMVFGDQRLVGNFGWSNVGRSFDGLRLAYALDALRVDAWAMVTKQFGSNVTADPAFSPSNRDAQEFYGIYTAVKAASFSLEPYVLYLRDTGDPNELDPVTGNLVSPITAPAARGQERATTGLRLDGKIMADTIDLTAEGAYQFGKMQARGTTPGSDISAYAFAFKAGYTLPATVAPHVGIEYDRASGDNNPNDDKFKTFENLFPTNHPFYGYMDYVGWRNMQDLRASLGIKPTKASGMSLDYHRFSLADKADNWYAASGKVFRNTPLGNRETALGQEADLVAYATIKEKLRLEAGYGRFFPGKYIKVNFPTANDPSDFVYLQMGVIF
jgi:hypothetical protein